VNLRKGVSKYLPSTRETVFYFTGKEEGEGRDSGISLKEGEAVLRGLAGGTRS